MTEYFVVMQIMIVLLDTLIVSDYLGTQLEKRKIPGYLSCAVFGLFGLCKYIQLLYGTALIYVTLLLFLPCLLFAVFLYEGSMLQKLKAVIKFLAIYFTVHLFIICTYAIFFEQIFAFGLYSWVISEALLLIFVETMYTTGKALEERELVGTDWVEILIVPVTNVFIMYGIIYITIACSPLIQDHRTIFMLLLVVIFVLLAFRFHRKTQRSEKQAKLNLLMRQEMAMYRKSHQDREHAMKEVRRFRHDYVNHLVCMNDFIQNKAYAQLESYCNNLMEEYAVLKDMIGVDSGNLVVDALLNHKTKAAREQNIQMLCNIVIPGDKPLPIEDVDISILLGNCLDNAIEAAQEIEDPEYRKIRLTLYYNKGNLFLKLSNPYQGNLAFDENGRLLTGKGNPEEHGLGLASVEEVVRKYDGSIERQTEGGQFVLLILLYGEE